MNTKELSYLLQHPESLDKGHTDSLEKIIKAFPYFQSVRLLHLKSLKNQDSFRYNQALKTTAAYSTDRSVLFDFITSDLFNKASSDSLPLKKQKVEIEVIDPEEIKVSPRIDLDDAVHMKIQEAEDVLDPSLFTEREKNSTLKQIQIAKSIADEEKSKEQKDISPEETLQIDSPLEFSKKETHSFAEWLKLTSLHPIERNSKPTENTDSQQNKEQSTSKSLEKKDKFDLIDEFIQNNPKIQPVEKNVHTRNLAKESSVHTDELMTETLAKVYLAQKKYKKAIQAYNILILKNPEKSGFFADQIRAIKKLQENK